VKLNLGTRLFISHFLAVALICGAAGTYLYYTAYHSSLDQIRLRLLTSAGLVSDTMGAVSYAWEEIQAPSDAGHPDYQKALSVLRDLKERNQDFAYLYIMRLEGESVRFVVDSDIPPHQALPGTLYPNPTVSMRAGFNQKVADPTITEDAWGHTISGYAPLGTTGRYLIGIDMRSNSVQENLASLHLAGAISLAATIILALFFSRTVSGYLVKPIRCLIRNCEKLASGKKADHLPQTYGDELGTLVTAFNRMLENLLVSRAQELEAKQTLLEVNAHLEKRVVERTAELTKAEESLREINATKDRLFSIIAHDLNSPLGGITGYAELLALKIDKLSTPDIRKFSAQIYASSKSLADLLSQLLSWASLQINQMPFQLLLLDLSELTQRAIAIIQLNATFKNIQVSAVLPPTCPFWGDNQMVGIIIRNLLSNAVKFTPPGGEVKVMLVRESQQIKLTVADSGVGMEASRLATLFTLATQQSTLGTQDERGTGLGLILVKEMVEKHQGSIEAHSRVGLGTTFTVTFPMTASTQL
jgi:signal transduction histidine kinase